MHLGKKLVFLVMFLPLVSFAGNDKALEQVIEQFGNAIKEKNKSGFEDLFIDKSVSWVGVFSEAQFEKYSKLVGEDAKPGRLHHSTPEEFIDWVIAQEGEPREEFKNVKILSDGEIAIIYFDYEFYLNDKRQNWGAESWMLVRTLKGWKIQSVNFSFTLDQ